METLIDPAPPPAAPGTSRIAALDGLRAIATLMVLIFHADGYVIWGFGAMGPDLFFLLSGFLITRLFHLERARTGRIDFFAFMVRRTLRLLPALWLVVATVLLITWLTYPDDAFRIVLRDAAATLAYVSNWVPIIIQEPNKLLGHSWSLSVETQFYLLWGALAPWLLSRLSPLRLFLLLAAIAVAMSGWTAWVYQHGATVAHMVYGFDTRGSPLFAGCAAAMLLEIPVLRAALESRLRRLRWAGVVALSGLIAMALIFGVTLPWILVVYATTLALLGSIVLIEVTLVPESPAARLLSWPPLAWLGLISYGLYLWHFPLMQLAVHFGGGLPARWFVCFAVGPLVALLSWRYVERPILTLKRGRPRLVPLGG